MGREEPGRQRTFAFAEPPVHETLAPGAVLLRGFARHDIEGLLRAVHAVAAASPFRRMVTPGGHRMSVAMTNCGAFGWVTDAAGYRYAAADPATGAPWPGLPEQFLRLAAEAARGAGHTAFLPDACLVNRYEPGARMTLHQDRNECDFGQPIVSVSLGLPAVFLLGGLARHDPVQQVPLAHGDVVVWGGPSRLRFHGVLPVKQGHHPATGRWRYNLTLRRAR